jgi:hypothetical protein
LLYKAKILKRDDGILHVETFKWTREIVPGNGEVDAFWEHMAGPSLVDTIARAEKIANEELRVWSMQPQLYLPDIDSE